MIVVLGTLEAGTTLARTHQVVRVVLHAAVGARFGLKPPLTRSRNVLDDAIGDTGANARTLCPQEHGLVRAGA